MQANVSLVVFPDSKNIYDKCLGRDVGLQLPDAKAQGILGCVGTAWLHMGPLFISHDGLSN